METFPDDITTDIFSRLPVKSFLRFSHLNKDIHKLTSTPAFVNKHLNFSHRRSPYPNLILTDTICQTKNHHNNLYLVQNEDQHPDRYTCHKVNLGIPNFQEFRTMGSCHGLVCLVHPRNRYQIYICNPCTGKYIGIPPPVSMPDRPGNIDVGFGVIPTTDVTRIPNYEYKVMAIIDFPEHQRQKVFVYTLGESSWKVKDNTTRLSLGQSACKAFVNGALHWVSDAKLIVSFDIATEEFGVVPRPELELGRGSFSLRSFRGHLSILNTSFGDRIEIWVMNDYGVVESWALVFTINHSQIGRNIRDVEIVYFLEDWGVLMVHDHGSLLCYNMKTEMASELHIDGLPKRFKAVSHVGTLVSPLFENECTCTVCARL